MWLFSDFNWIVSVNLNIMKCKFLENVTFQYKSNIYKVSNKSNRWGNESKVAYACLDSAGDTAAGVA